MAVAFLREAEAVLKDGGYELDRKSGKSHGVWKHPDSERPAIHVPGTPRDPDHALVRLRRAVRTGSTPHIPQGLESDMKQQKHVPLQRSLAEQLVHHAPAGLTRRVSEAQSTGNTPRATPKLVADWLRKSITSHGALPSSDLNAAAEELLITHSHLSVARKTIGAVVYRPHDAAGPREPSWTDFAGRTPEGASILGRGPSKIKQRRAGPVTSSTMPKDPDEPGGRRLDQGGLTPEQHAEAERMMRESTERADAELEQRRAELARLTAPEAIASVAGETNGKPKTQLEIAMQLLQEAALADTHALTDDDIVLLRGHQDTMKRLRDDIEGMSASLGAILRRVEKRETAPA